MERILKDIAKTLKSIDNTLKKIEKNTRKPIDVLLQGLYEERAEVSE